MASPSFSVARIRKAVAAFLIPFVPAVVVVVDSASGPITSTEWVLLVTSAAAGLGVYAIPNRQS